MSVDIRLMEKRATATDQNARAAALDLMAQVQGGALLSEALSGLEKLRPEDRARAQRLAETTFRWQNRADRMLSPFLRMKPRDIVMNALRLGTVEMAVTGAAHYGVINDLVTVVGADKKASGASGLTNAVLRRISKALGDWDDLPAPQLPKKLRQKLVKIYGKEDVALIEAAHVRAAPLDLTMRAGDAVDLRIFKEMKAVRLPNGSVRVHQAGQVSKLPGFEEGAWWVQDAAASLPAQILAAQPGARVLDMCAAPGGKTMQLAAAGASVTAIDLSEKRLARVHENLLRTGLKAEVVAADALTFEADAFDAILLDAPCSATGTIRRHPDLPIAKAAVDFSELVALQAAMLDRAVALLKPSGRLVFCTCSLFPEEGEDQVQGVLERGLPIELDLDALNVPGVQPDWVGAHGLRLRPDYWSDLGGMDGFFISAFRKSA